jgi:hypothetical protein
MTNGRKGESEMNEKGSVEVAFGAIVIMGFVILCSIGLWGCPKYRVYSQDMTGQANLKQEEWEKKIAVEEAKAVLESSKYKADAEITRARGVAEANKIIGDSLKGNEAYLRYLWIKNLENADQSGQVIYVPTEAGLPILEANRLKR